MIERIERIQSVLDGERARDVALLGLRGVVAAVFVFHGSQKLFGWFGGYGLEGTAGWMEGLGIPLPMLSALLAGAAEFFGGLALASGFFARLAALPMLFTMGVAMATAHSGFDAAAGGIEYPLTLAVVLAAIAIQGPGRLTLARALTSARPPQRFEAEQSV
jgi:putative oxidoreductase